MLILLPPSEGKRAGGEPGSRLDLAALRFRGLDEQREAALAGVEALAEDPSASLRALGLKPGREQESAKNRVVRSSPVLPAALRFTGVLYEALDAASLPPSGVELLRSCVVVHTALLGPVGAMDPVPDHRLSADSRLPGLSMKKLWAAPVARELAAVPGLVVDARSRAYVSLGPAPAGSLYLDVVTEDAGGVRRALGHFNKKAKGELVRALALHGDPELGLDGLLRWARSAGFRLEVAGDAAERRLVLVV